MRKVLVGLILLLMVAVPALAEVYNFTKEGYSFHDDVTMGAVGLLEPLQTQNPPFEFDFDTYEVSWALLDMTIVDYYEVMTIQVWEMTGGTIGIYEDPGFDLDYGVDPATGIATATNGTPALTGTVTDAAMMFDTNTQTGTFTGNMLFSGGSRYADLGVLGDVDWHLFDGASANDQVNVPPGYHTRFVGRMFTDDIVATEETSFSKIRSLY